MKLFDRQDSRGEVGISFINYLVELDLEVHTRLLLHVYDEVDTNPDKKIAGRACYNMAVACERDGNLQLALTYAEKAAAQFQLKTAFTYINQIKKRISNKQKLDYQMGN